MLRCGPRARSQHDLDTISTRSRHDLDRCASRGLIAVSPCHHVVIRRLRRRRDVMTWQDSRVRPSSFYPLPNSHGTATSHHGRVTCGASYSRRGGARRRRRRGRRACSAGLCSPPSPRSRHAATSPTVATPHRRATVRPRAVARTPSLQHERTHAIVPVRSTWKTAGENRRRTAKTCVGACFAPRRP